MHSPLLRLSLLPLSLLGLAACGQVTHSSEQIATDNKVELLSQGALLAATCSGCHSDQAGAMASLNTYTEPTLIEAMSRYKSERDGTTVMHRLARGYSDDDILALSAYLGTEKAAP